MLKTPRTRSAQRNANTRTRWLSRLAPIFVAAITAGAAAPALADLPHNPGVKTRAAMAQSSARGLVSATHAAEGARHEWQGKRLEHLIMASSRLLFATPLEVNAANPLETGANCGVGQEGPVWFLSGPGGLSNFTLDCTMPAGKAIFMPALGYLYDFPCPEPFPQLTPGQSLETFLRGLTADAIDQISFASITMDGKQVKLRRASTGVFPFTGAKDWVKYDACVTGAPQLLQADGLWALIDPPPVGKHVIGLTLTHPWFGTIQGTWNLNVVK